MGNKYEIKVTRQALEQMREIVCLTQEISADRRRAMEKRRCTQDCREEFSGILLDR